MLEYVLTVSILWERCCDTYAGSFDSCLAAHSYYELYLADSYGGSSCLHENMIILPAGFSHEPPERVPLPK
jgi:hypothetical protein